MSGRGWAWVACAVLAIVISYWLLMRAQATMVIAEAEQITGAH